MRAVHDILSPLGLPHLKVAFIQHGNPEDGFVYESVCPWCEGTIEKVTVAGEATFGVVLNRLLQGQTRHYFHCPNRGTGKVQVEITTRPLNTSHLIKEY